MDCFILFDLKAQQPNFEALPGPFSFSIPLLIHLFIRFLMIAWWEKPFKTGRDWHNRKVLAHKMLSSSYLFE